MAYLVGGGVRDLLLERQPKDFDIGTSAHPQQVRKLFRNCFIVGRRFRLAHVRFGRKVVEVSTFRKAAEPEGGDTLIHRDNTFGTPEEDAFRRDFTVNALFYDIANFSVIDWVHGIEDLIDRVIRTIGDPAVRFREDPVRMLRAVALAARLDFTIDPDTAEALRALRGEIVRSSSARILEEFYKILRQGRSRRTFEMLHEYGLLAYILPEADQAISRGREALLGSLARLDAHRQAGLATPDQLTNPLLMGSLLVPLGVPLRRVAAAAPPPRRARPERAGRARSRRATTWPPRSRSWAPRRTRTRRRRSRAGGAALAPLRPARPRAPAAHPAGAAAPARGRPSRPRRGARWSARATSRRRCAGSRSTAARRSASSPRSGRGSARPTRRADDEPSPEPAPGAAPRAREGEGSRRRRRRRRRRPPSEPDAPA